MKDGYAKQIRDRIEQAEEGTLLTVEDFADLDNRVAASHNLFLAEKRGTVRRVLPGVYEKPRRDGEKILPADADRAVRAVAKSNHWTVVPAGDYALYLLGLIPEEPEQLLYASNGSMCSYCCDGREIVLKRRSNRDLAGLSEKTALVAQALKALKKGNVTQETIAAISSSLTDEERKALLEESGNCSEWVRREFQKISAYPAG